MSAVLPNSAIRALETDAIKAIKAEVKKQGGEAGIEDKFYLNVAISRDPKFDPPIEPRLYHIFFSAKKTGYLHGGVFTNARAFKQKEPDAFGKGLKEVDLLAIENVFTKIFAAKKGTFKQSKPFPESTAVTMEDLIGGLNQALSPENQIDTSKYIGKHIGHR